MFTILYGDKFSVCVRDIERDARHNGAQQRRHSASWDLVSYKLFAEYHSQATFGTLGRVLWTKLTDLDLIYQNYRPRPLVNAVSPFTGASPPTAVSKSEGLRNRNSSNYNKTEFQPKPVSGPGAQTDLKRVKKMTNDAAKYQELEVTWLRGLEFKIIPRQMWARLWSRPVLSITGWAIRSLNLEFYLHCGARPA